MATVTAIKTQSGDIPTHEELVDRARAMIPTLKKRAKQTTADRNVSKETIAEMQAAGFFKVLQPKRLGGYEMHPNVFFDVQKQLAEGCMSTGWVYGVLGCHPYEMALFHDKAQQEVWGEDPSMLVSSTYQPVGKVEHADGGFYLSGHWGFSSGSVHCGWVLLGALIFPEGGEGRRKCGRSCCRVKITRLVKMRGTFLACKERAVTILSSIARLCRNIVRTKRLTDFFARTRAKKPMKGRSTLFPGRKCLRVLFQRRPLAARVRRSMVRWRLWKAVFHRIQARLRKKTRCSTLRSRRPMRSRLKWN
ncbi:acyl-CoA dehydrogenase family protein [Parasphingorhabdus halotolerans]|uniref:acyl-CoA dehydrogenase family protein n=1 Tax=Parasphingorhabdus halotolerans TaxID=2725558 RepID=UPI001FE59AA4|nr:acyl-CoA dehydrogenase family protein [Parasphingorhabdus halotolerans]